jgi:DNA-binding NarL/FixJ family response regulator
VAVGSVPLDGVVRVAVIEDTDVVVEGVRSWIANDPRQRAVIVAVANTIAEALSGPGRDADVLVLDLQLGETMVSSRVAELTDAGYRVVVYSVHVAPLVVRDVLAAGASAFLDKRTEKDQFVDMIVDVAHDRPHVTQSMAGGMLDAVDLSPREREALLLLFQGMTYASIARRMMKADNAPISRETAKQYVERARAKLAAKGRPCRSNFALLARCIELGLIRAEEVEDYRSTAAEPE